jgi:site-specific recombinase XerC
MRRRRFQKPKVRNIGGYWIAQFRDLERHKRKVSLGPVLKTKKYEAEAKLAQIMEPINARLAEPSPSLDFRSFVKQLYLPFYERKWKGSTLLSNQERIGYQLVTAFGDQPLSRLDRNHLQDFLDQKAQGGLSYSVVAHLRWDPRQILRMAVAEGYLARNPAELLFVPRDARKPAHVHLNLDQVRLFFSVLDLRERVIGGLAILAGMRTHSCLLDELGVDPQVRAEMGHTVDVNQNKYTRSSLERRLRAVNSLEEALGVATGANGSKSIGGILATH